MAAEPVAAGTPAWPSEPFTLTADDLREAVRAAVRAVFYPAIPAWDDESEARVDRATMRLLAALGHGEVAL